MFYQQNPIYAVIFVVLFLGIYLFFKSRKHSRGGFAPGMFFSGRTSSQDNNMNDYIMFLMLQQHFNSSPQSHSQGAFQSEQKVDPRQAYIEKTQGEVLELLQS